MGRENQSKKRNLLPGSKTSKPKCLCEEREIDCIIDIYKLPCFVSARPLKRDIIKCKFNCSQTVEDIYSMMKNKF